MMVIPTHHEPPSAAKINNLFPFSPSANLDITLHSFPSFDFRCPGRNIFQAAKSNYRRDGSLRQEGTEVNAASSSK
ncbi:hypothetical protein Tco_1335268 [Tanacetum coccineum]